MTVPTTEILTRELKRRFAQTHPGEPEPYLEIEEMLPERIKYYVRIGSKTYESSIHVDDIMGGPLDYISDKLMDRHLKKPVVI